MVSFNVKLEILRDNRFGVRHQGADGEFFPMCEVFPFATRMQPVKHEGYVKVRRINDHLH